MIVNSSSENQNQFGSTLQENGMVVFIGNLKRILEEEKPETFNKYLTGVLLHEFGHQIGLAHNNEYGCIMNESVEIDSAKSVRNIQDDFCPFEKRQIKSVRY